MPNLLSSKTLAVHLSSPQDNGATISVAAIEAHTSIGGANVMTNTGLASCRAGGSNPGNAVDGNAATVFSAPGPDTWWAYTAASAFNALEVKITAPNDANFARAPKNIAFYIKDASGQLMQIDVAVGLTWAQGESKSFALAAALSFERQSRAYLRKVAAGQYIEPPVEQAPAPPSSTVIAPLYSTSSAKTSPAQLSGATVSGDVYIYLPSDPLLTKVEFWFDSAAPSAPTEPVYHTENLDPWDFLGSQSAAPYGPTPLSTATLPNGNHTVSIRITYNGVVQPVYYATFNVSNGVTKRTVWKSGWNIGTAKNSDYFNTMQTWLGRNADASTVNAIGFSLANMAFFSGSYGFNYFGTEYWNAVSWMPSNMLLNLQVAPCGADPSMFPVTTTVQNNYNAMMVSQAAGNNYSAWYEIGRSHATRGRHRGNSILCLGHELNGSWYPWNPATVSGGTTTWKNMFIQAVIPYRAGFASVRTDVLPPYIGWGYGANPDYAWACPNVWDAYPGDTYVDVIIVHRYDTLDWSNYTSWTSERAYHNSVAAAVDYCVSKKSTGGPKLFIGEWCLTNSPSGGGSERVYPAQDNTTFIQMMYDMLLYCQQQGVLLGDSLFQDFGSQFKNLYPQVNNGTHATNINASNLYKTLWGS